MMKRSNIKVQLEKEKFQREMSPFVDIPVHFLHRTDYVDGKTKIHPVRVCVEYRVISVVVFLGHHVHTCSKNTLK